MDLKRYLSTALKAKAKYVGIPIEGRAPFIFDRKKLVLGLKGVTITHVVADTQSRWLHIHGTAGPNVTHRSSRPSLDRCLVLREIQKGKRQVPAIKLTPIDKEIEKTCRELRKLSPASSLMRLPRERQPEPARDYERQCELAWHKDKQRRKAVSWLAGLALKGRVTHKELYAVLKAKDYRFSRFSELRAPHHKLFMDEYLKGLYKHTGLASNPHNTWERKYKAIKPDPQTAKERHAWRIAEYRRRVELESRLASLKELKELKEMKELKAA